MRDSKIIRHRLPMASHRVNGKWCNCHMYQGLTAFILKRVKRRNKHGTRSGEYVLTAEVKELEAARRTR